MPEPKKVAVVTTVYRKWSHADVIAGKIIEGYNYDGRERPNLQVVSMYVDQRGPNDMSGRLAKQFGFRVYDSIAGALTLGGKELAVDGVISIGEHGKYPTSAQGQILYPRRRFFEEICKVFEKSKRSVPVFSDKHLAATWEDAKWMYDRSRELFVPFLAGSSVPVTWRRPNLRLPRNCPLTSAVQLCYGPFEGYGFHGLEGLQCMAERRQGGETGIKAVQCLQGEEMWKSLDQGRWSKEVLDAGTKLVNAHSPRPLRESVGKDKEGGVFLVEYSDGFQGAVAMLNGWIYEGEGGNMVWAGKLKDRAEPVATMFFMQQPDPFGHFTHLVKAIESMIQTGHAPYPVERTLLTTGVVEAIMRSKHEKGRRVETPHLAIKYQPADWPYATDPVPMTIKRTFPEEK